MKRSILSLSLGVLCATSAVAAPPQKSAPVKKVTAPAVNNSDVKQLMMLSPKASQFPNASKYTINDLGDVVIRPDGSHRVTTRQTLTIFTERGRDDESEVRIPYNESYDKVVVLRARTIKPDGTVINVKPTDIRDQGAGVDNDGYSDARVKSFSLPAVSPGCILDYEYYVESKQSNMKGQFWYNWLFQSGAGLDPVRVSRLTITAPKSLKIQKDLRNATVQATEKPTADGKNVTYSWQDTNIQPLEYEPMMPSSNKFAPLLNVTTVPSWQSIADWYLTLAETRMVASPEIKKQVALLTAGKTTQEEKAKAIFYFVEERTRYIGIFLGAGTHQPRPAQTVFETQYGDCKDMATLLVAMLRAAGITAHPVLLNSGSTEKVSTELPSPAAFNHAICLAEIDGKKYWLDATAQICPFGQIPGGDRGSEAFVIREGKGTFEVIPFADPTENAINQDVKITLNADGSAKGSVTISGTGDVDFGLRGALLSLPPDKRRNLVESMAQSIGQNAKVTNFAVSDFKDKDKPVVVSFDVSFPKWASSTGDLLLFKAKAEQTDGQSSSPFRTDFRKYPIVQDSIALGNSTLEITLPAGFTVLSLPKTANVTGDLGQYLREVGQDGNRLIIKTKGASYKAEIPAARYGDVKKYYDEYLRLADESVIIKKPQ